MPVDAALVSVQCHPNPDVPLVFAGFATLTDVMTAAAWVIVVFSDVVVIVDDPGLDPGARTVAENRLVQAAFALARSGHVC